MFKGCYVALVTPFRDGSVDRLALEELVNFVIEGGVSGVVACGTTGESPTLSIDEQVDVIQAVVQRTKKRVPVLAGTGTNCTEKSVSLSQAAVKAGADGVMLVAPYYNKPNQRGLYQHFSYIAQCVSAPVVLYNIPGRCGVEISIETIARLRADHRNIVAVKHATGSIDAAGELAALSDIAILSGDDSLTVPLMLVGAVGVISVVANLLPRQTSAMVRAAATGDWGTAQAMHRQLLPLVGGLMRLDTNPIPIKTALSMRGMMTDEFRLPLCRMESAKKEQLRSLIERYPAPSFTRQTA